MHFKSILTYTVLSTLPIYTIADCTLENKGTKDNLNKFEENEWLCLKQGKGDWTFSMELSAVNFPSFDADNPFAGFVSSSGFAIYDHDCKLKGSYDPSQSNSCGVPYVIKEKFLKKTLKVTSVNFDAASGFFSFEYGDAKYTINKNHCDCVEKPDGLRARAFCKCAFPVDGHFDGKRRGIEFEA